MMYAHGLKIEPCPRPDSTPRQRSVVYFTQNSLSNRDIERFGIAYYAERGFDVTVFDIADIIQPHLSFERNHYEHQRNFNLITISSLRELLAQTDVLRRALFIVFFVKDS